MYAADLDTVYRLVTDSGEAQAAQHRSQDARESCRFGGTRARDSPAPPIPFLDSDAELDAELDPYLCTRLV